ncbi:MAG TPA: 16S rRNA (cytosine(967)-C(5))-methyltransferase RsmB [Chromatiales bacterium]|nr:16S rRNA (cytosine(967)-C(5))-methyltransferase RsmB [Chromatiales bacterium]
MPAILSTHVIFEGRSLAETATAADGGTQGGARAEAARVLVEVLEKRRSLTQALARRFTQGADDEGQALIQELCYGVMRYLPRLEALAEALLKRPLKRKDRDIYALILLGLYQLTEMRTAEHAAVAETVEAARRLRKPWAAGLINGVLRNFQRRREALMARVLETDEGAFACPPWLLDALREAWPDRWRAIAAATLERPPMTVRVNRRRLARHTYLEQLADAGIAARPAPHAPEGVVLERPMTVDALPGFRDGRVSVQDAGAQLAAHLLPLQPDQQVLDACAAPGGKTCHLLEIAPPGVRLTAVDIDADRLRSVQDNLDRLGLEAEVVQGDAARPSGAWAQRRYDHILLDAPCSATGVIRRHPDIKYLRRASDIEELAARQAKMLDAMWSLLAPGGMLLYVTCSLLPQENESQVAGFLRRCPHLHEVPLNDEWGHCRAAGRQTLPGEESMDGFYYALMERME